MECKVWSVKRGVEIVKCRMLSVDCTVWSAECKVWSVKCRVWTENQRLQTRHVGAAKRAFRARLPPILSISTQVGMPQSATPATQNDMTTCLETFEKERF